jgi:uncharacterized protein (DUF1330 family)
VTSIGTSAFSDCTSLNSIRFDGDAPYVVSGAFNNTQIPYIIVGSSVAASYGGEGATFNGFTVVDYSKVATAANLYNQSNYNTVVAERDAALAAHATAVAERDTAMELAEQLHYEKNVAYDGLSTVQTTLVSVEAERDAALAAQAAAEAERDAKLTLD